MLAKSSLVDQVSILLVEPCSSEEGIALLELVLQKLGEAKTAGFREVKTENLVPPCTEPIHAEPVHKSRHFASPECELSTPQELLAVMEATKHQVSSFLGKVETEKTALRTHLSVLGTLTARYKQQCDIAHTAKQVVQKELTTIESAYVELQEEVMSDKDTIAELNRRLKAEAEAEEHIHSLRRQLALRGAEFNKLDSQVYSLQFQVNTLTEQIRFLETQGEKDNARYKELQQKLEKTTAELALAREDNDDPKLARGDLQQHPAVFIKSVLAAGTKEPQVASAHKRPRHDAELPGMQSDHEEDTKRQTRADQMMPPIKTEENSSHWSDLEAMDAKIMQKAVEWGGRGNGLGDFLEKELGFGAKLRMCRLLQMKT